jgi:hypothetical protein
MQPATRTSARALLTSTLCGLVIDKISYSVTEWRLRFATAGDFSFWCAELACPDATQWQKSLIQAPFQLDPSNELSAAVALAVFEIANKFPVESVDVVGDDADLEIRFQNGRVLTALGAPEGVDLSWGLDRDSVSLLSCSFGELCMNPSLSRHP